MFGNLYGLRAFLGHGSKPVQPLVLWDIDGPLNPFRASGLADDERFTPHATAWNSGLFNKVDHPVWARRLLAHGVGFVWVSNWADEANQVGFALGLSEPIAHIPLESGEGDTWKLDSVKLWAEELTPGTPLIWVDDELGNDARAWATERGKTLLVPVDAAVGWTFDQLLTMEEWLLSNG